MHIIDPNTQEPIVHEQFEAKVIQMRRDAFVESMHGEVNKLLARCYENLANTREKERAVEAFELALFWIASSVRRHDLIKTTPKEELKQ